MSDNLEAGLDITGFSPEKLARLREFVVVFEKLEKYHGKAFQPIAGGGLTELNQSISQTSKLLDELNTKISNLGSGGSASKELAAVRKENTELTLALAAYKKQADAVASSNAKLAATTSEQAKKLAELRVALQEENKALIEEAKNNNASVQARNNAKEAAKQEAAQLKEAARQRKKDAQEVAAAEKQAARDIANSHKTMEKAVKDHEKEVERLNDKYGQLKSLLKSQQKEYVNNFANFGESDPRTRKSLSNVNETQGIITALNKDMGNAAGNSYGMAVNLTKALSTLRLIAYVLPGIGLAGIFNLAFEAIGKSIQSMGVFNSALEKASSYEKELNSGFSTQLSLFEDIIQKMKEIKKLREDSYETENKRIDTRKAGGQSADKTLVQDLNNIKNKFVEVDAKIKEQFGAPSQIDRILNERLNVIKTYSLDLAKAKQLEIRNYEFEKNGLSEADKKKTPAERVTDLNRRFGALAFVGKDELIAYQEATQKKLAFASEQYNILKGYADEYYQTLADKEKKDAELKKFILDKNREEYVKTNTDKANTEISNQQKIAESVISTDKQKLDAEKAIFEARKRIISLNLYNVTQDRDISGDPSKVPQEVREAFSKAASDTRIALNDYEEKIFNLKDSFRMRDLKATVETEKNRTDAIAIANERIFQNTKKTLEERINAYNEYVKAKDKIADLEYNLGMGELGLSEPQKVEKASNRDKQKSNNKANSEKILYDIVSSDAQTKLKAIVDTNILQNQQNRKQYADELEALNTSFSNKQISYRKFLGELKNLKDKFSINQEEQDIINDSQELKRLNDLLIEQKAKRDEYAGLANSEKDPKKKADLESQYDAEVDAINNTEKEKQVVRDRLSKNSLDKQEAVREKILRGERLLEENKRRIQEETFKLTKKLIDQAADRELEKIALIRNAQDEAFDNQKDAVERSTLDAKNKTALEIQLAQQKKEFDINSTLEERKIKHDNAVADKELAIAEATINGFQAVTKTVAEYGGTPLGLALALSVGTLSALQVASIALTDIPAYEFGTQGVPHKGGPARVGEKNKKELVFEPYKTPYLIEKDGIYNLPVNTEVFPISDMNVSAASSPDGWEQTLWLAGQLKPKNQKIVNKNTINITIDQSYRKRILG
jgi:hypothetical protein